MDFHSSSSLIIIMILLSFKITSYLSIFYLINNKKINYDKNWFKSKVKFLYMYYIVFIARVGL